MTTDKFGRPVYTGPTLCPRAGGFAVIWEAGAVHGATEAEAWEAYRRALALRARIAARIAAEATCEHERGQQGWRCAKCGARVAEVTVRRRA